MHEIQFDPTANHNTKFKSVGDYKRVIVLSENDFKIGLRNLRGKSCQLILIPKDFDIDHKDNQDIKFLIYSSLYPSGEVKFY